MSNPVDFFGAPLDTPTRRIREAAHDVLRSELARLTHAPELRARLFEDVSNKIRATNTTARDMRNPSYADTVPFWEALGVVLAAYAPTIEETGHVANVLRTRDTRTLPGHCAVCGAMKDNYNGELRCAECCPVIEEQDETFDRKDRAPCPSCGEHHHVTNATEALEQAGLLCVECGKWVAWNEPEEPNRGRCECCP